MALPFYSYLFKKYKSICSCKDLYMNVHASVRQLEKLLLLSESSLTDALWEN